MVYNKILNTLNTYNKKTIDEKVVRNSNSNIDYIDYFNIINKLIEDKRLEPIKSSGPNGMNPPLHKRYRIIKDENSYEHLIEEIRFLDTVFNIEAYLLNPERYLEHKDFILKIDDFIKNRREELEIEASVNERSFQILGQEKAFKVHKIMKSIFVFNPQLEKTLNFYDTPEPFFTHHIKDIDPLEKINILIIENKDTWYTLRKLLTPNSNTLFGIDFHILLYGEGKKIARTISSLTDFKNIILKDIKAIFYYFGDLDYEGINIFKSLTKRNEELDIRLLTPLYKEMIKLSKKIELPTTKDLQKEKNIDEFLKDFNNEEKRYIENILKSRKYIPQEIISYREFLRLLKMRDSYV